MPLKGSFEWQEKKDLVQIQIPLKGVSPAKVDIFVTASTLKVNFSPYLIDIVLCGAVDSLRHKAKVRAGVLKITLFKAQDNQTIWGSLEVSDNEEKKTLRQSSTLQQQELEEKQLASRKDRKLADERYSVRKQMALEEAERSRLEGKKEEEKHNAEEEMYATFSKLQSSAPSEEKLSIASNDDRRMKSAAANFISDSDLDDMIDAVDDNIEEQQEVSNDDGSGEQEHEETEAMPETEDTDLKYVPPPRSANSDSCASSSKFNINFTPRVFPTPMRESTQANEDDWIAKNRKHLKKHGTLGQNIPKGNGVDITEEDPAWLKAKGDDFFRVGDYLSAMNAYSAALDVDDTLVSCYSNRSACYLKLSSPHDCKADCTQAIELIKKGDSIVLGEERNHTKILLKMLMRRGIANCQQGLYKDAISDYEACLQILLENTMDNFEISAENLRSDTEKLRKLENADLLKKSADTKFSQSEIAEALLLYSDALLESPLHVGCLSNRAACKIATRDFSGCIKDCSLALEIFDSDDTLQKNTPIQSGSSENLSMLTAILPIRGSDKRKSWYLKTLVRRGAAHFQAGNLAEAIADYGKACAIDPSNNALKTDLNNLRNSRSS